MLSIFFYILKYYPTNLLIFYQFTTKVSSSYWIAQKLFEPIFTGKSATNIETEEASILTLEGTQEGVCHMDIMLSSYTVYNYHLQNGFGCEYLTFYCGCFIFYHNHTSWTYLPDEISYLVNLSGTMFDRNHLWSDRNQRKNTISKWLLIASKTNGKQCKKVPVFILIYCLRHRHPLYVRILR